MIVSFCSFYIYLLQHLMPQGLYPTCINYIVLYMAIHMWTNHKEITYVDQIIIAIVE